MLSFNYLKFIVKLLKSTFSQGFHNLFGELVFNINGLFDKLINSSCLLSGEEMVISIVRSYMQIVCDLYHKCKESDHTQLGNLLEKYFIRLSESLVDVQYGVITDIWIEQILYPISHIDSSILEKFVIYYQDQLIRCKDCIDKNKADSCIASLTVIVYIVAYLFDKKTPQVGNDIMDDTILYTQTGKLCSMIFALLQVDWKLQCIQCPIDMLEISFLEFIRCFFMHSICNISDSKSQVIFNQIVMYLNLTNANDILDLAINKVLYCLICYQKVRNIFLKTIEVLSLLSDNIKECTLCDNGKVS